MIFRLPQMGESPGKPSSGLLALSQDQRESSGSQTFSDVLESSQASSSIPSPIVTTLDKVLGIRQDSGSQSLSQMTDSQTSSIPSPVVTRLDKLFSLNTCHEDIGCMYTRLPQLNPDEKIAFLNILIPLIDKNDLSKLSDEVVNHLSKVLGEYCHEKLKPEADFFRSKRSREDDDEYLSSVGILSKKLKVEQLHVFYEAATGKSGRQPGKHQTKVAPLQATFYESLLKGANLYTVGPFNLSKMNEMKTKVSSKAIFQDQSGGSYQFHKNTSTTVPLEMSQNGSLISDNAQRGCSNYQHFSFGKLDRSTPVEVSTHNIRVESEHGIEDNEIFKNEKVAPYNFEFHPIFRPVNPGFIKVVEERLECDRKNGQLAVNTILQSWMTEVIEDKKVGDGMSSFEKMSARFNFGLSARTVICQKCHTEYEYKVDSHNICPQCNNNPTLYTDTELGPYRRFNFPEKQRPNSVKVMEQEPIHLNPSGRKNLFSLHDQLKNFWPADVKCFPFYGDGLPAISYERIKSDSVDCLTHKINIPLKDTRLLIAHCTEDCELDWPLKDLYVISGMSHEVGIDRVLIISKQYYRLY